MKRKETISNNAIKYLTVHKRVERTSSSIAEASIDRI